MANFSYTAKNAQHKIIKGEIDADSRHLVLEKLKKDGLTPITVESKFSLNSISFGSNKLSIKDRYIFTQQLSVMIRAGLPIVEALTILSEEAENKKLHKVLKEIVTDIKSGNTLSDSFSKSKVFPTYYIAVLKSGEKSGKLDIILQRLAQHMEQDYQLRSKLKNALLLPMIVLIAMLVVIVILLIFVIPQLMNLFTESDVALPLPTRILMGSSTLLQNYWYIFLLILILLFIGFKFAAKTKQGSAFIDEFKLKVPIFGKLTRTVTMSRLCGTMSTLMGSGMPVLEIIDTCAEVVDNNSYRQILTKAKNELQKGKSLSESLKEKKHIPVLVNHMIAIGEKSGNTEFVLNEVSKFYEEEANAMTKNLMTMMEPLITVGLGIGVAFIVLSVLMPIYKLIDATK